MSLILDFDGTITESDTIANLAEFAASQHIPELATDLAEVWKDISSKYLADCKAHTEAYVPAACDRTTLAAELDFLESLRPVELASIERVQKIPLFLGIPTKVLFEYGRDAAANKWDFGPIRLREGLSEFLAATSKSWKLGVLSVNWSADFIEGVLSIAAPDLEIPVLANTTSPETGWIKGSAGLVDRAPLTGAHDKFEALETLLSAGDAGPAAKSVYIGDSITDLQCLVSIRGIVMTPDGEGKLMDTLKRLSYEVPHVSECPTDWKLAWAKNFKEILESGLL